MKQLAKWAFVDDNHRLFIDIPFLLNALKMEDTPANRELAIAGALEAIEAVCPDKPVFRPGPDR